MSRVHDWLERKRSSLVRWLIGERFHMQNCKVLGGVEVFGVGQIVDVYFEDAEADPYEWFDPVPPPKCKFLVRPSGAMMEARK